MTRRTRKMIACLLTGIFVLASVPAYAEEEIASDEPVQEEVYEEPSASVNGTDYASLQEAFDNAGGGTVTLVKDVKLTESVIVTGNAVLDLNGFTISNDEHISNDADETSSLISVRGGMLTVKGDGTVKPLEGDCFCFDVRDGGMLIIENGEFIGNESAVFVKNGKAEINGGKFRLASPSGYNGRLICADESALNDESASIIINDGSFENWDCIGTNGVSYLPNGMHAVPGSDGLYVPGEHDYVLSDDSVPAGCEELGYDILICNACGDEILEETPATGHDYQENTDGGMVCQNCGDIILGEQESGIATYSTDFSEGESASASNNGSAEDYSEASSGTSDDNFDTEGDFTEGASASASNTGNSGNIDAENASSGTSDDNFDSDGDLAEGESASAGNDGDDYDEGENASSGSSVDFEEENEEFSADEPSAEEETEEESEENVEYAVAMRKGFTDENISDELLGLYGSADAVMNELTDIIAEQWNTVSEDNTAFYEAEIMKCVNGGEWEEDPDADCADEDIVIIVSYPEGTDSENEFFAVHMFSGSVNGHEAGDYEIPEIEKTDEGIQLTLNGLSPIALAWNETEEATSEEEASSDAEVIDVEPTTLSDTDGTDGTADEETDETADVTDETEYGESESDESETETETETDSESEQAAKDITNAEVSGIETSYEYSGTAVEPEPVLTMDGTELVKDTDYTVSYENNDATGTATLIITGIGEYSGTITLNFELTEPAAEPATEKTTEAQTEHEHKIVTDPAVQPTCEKTGLTAGTHCETCGKIIEAQKEIPANGHTEVVTKGYDATCTEPGLSDGSYCNVCGKILTKQEEIPALGHNFEWIVDVEPTEDTRGSRHQVCTRCGETGESEEILSLAEQRAAEEEEAKNADTVQTGDTTPVQIVLVIMVIALCTFIIVLLIIRRRKG